MARRDPARTAATTVSILLITGAAAVIAVTGYGMTDNTPAAPATAPATTITASPTGTWAVATATVTATQSAIDAARSEAAQRLADLVEREVSGR